MAFDDAGRLLVASIFSAWVTRFRGVDRQPEVDLLLGCPEQGGGLLDSCRDREVSAEALRVPRDVAVDAGGGVYVTDSGHHRVLVFDRP